LRVLQGGKSLVQTAQRIEIKDRQSATNERGWRYNLRSVDRRELSPASEVAWMSELGEVQPAGIEPATLSFVG
jgi:hypothetical protein